MLNSDAPKPVPFNDLARGTTASRDLIDGAIARVLDSGWFVLGPEHDSLERELADYLGAGDAIAVGNGTDALEIALRGLGVESGASVVTVANAGGYTSTAVRAIGATPLYADVDEATLQMTVATLDAALASAERRPSAIVVTHLFGAVGDIQGIVTRASELGIPVVEDCAQSLGATVGDRKAGTFGTVATTSFYPTKNLGALGDGGAIFTSDHELADRLRKLRQYGWESKYRASVIGGRNSRLDEMQAAILRAKLPQLDGWNERRRDIHRAYEAAVTGDQLVNTVTRPYAGHLAVLDCDDREATRARFVDAQIRTDVHYPIPDHQQPLADPTAIRLPVTDRSAVRILSIPLFPELTDDEVERVCQVLGRA